MQGTTGTTGITENVHTERLDVGPFKYDELELIAKNALRELGLKWDDIPIAEQRGFLDQEIMVLMNKPPTNKMADTSGSKVDVEFRKLVLSSLKNSPKWDDDAFVRGYTIQNARGKENLGTQGEARA
jgi:hypothetical protein